MLSISELNDEPRLEHFRNLNMQLLGRESELEAGGVTDSFLENLPCGSKGNPESAHQSPLQRRSPHCLSSPWCTSISSTSLQQRKQNLNLSKFTFTASMPSNFTTLRSGWTAAVASTLPGSLTSPHLTGFKVNSKKSLGWKEECGDCEHISHIRKLSRLQKCTTTSYFINSLGVDSPANRNRLPADL